MTKATRKPKASSAATFKAVAVAPLPAMQGKQDAVFNVKLSNGFTVADNIQHMVRQYDELQLLQLNAIDIYVEIGTRLLEIRSLIKSHKLFGAFIAKTDLANISRQDRGDAMWLAANAATVRKAYEAGKLPDGLGVSAIRKRLKPTQPRTADTKASPSVAADGSSVTSKPKASVAGNVVANMTVEPKAEAPAMTPDELATEVLGKLDTFGITVPEFAAALMKLVNARKVAAS